MLLRRLYEDRPKFTQNRQRADDGEGGEVGEEERPRGGDRKVRSRRLFSRARALRIYLFILMRFEDAPGEIF